MPRVRREPNHLSKLVRDEQGSVLGLVSFGLIAMVLMTVLIHQLASTEISQAEFYDREDSVLAGTEAMLERYATKLTIDPIYYNRYVDEAEAPRRCTDASSLSNGLLAQPGGAWFPDCQTWSYEYTADFFNHPLLGGEPGNEGDAIEVLLHVSPPAAGEPLEVTVVGRQDAHINRRSVVAELRAESISQFVRMVETDLRYGSGAKTFGKIYVGNNVGYVPGGEAHGNLYAENKILIGGGYGLPQWMDGAEGWDSTGNHNSLGEVIADVYPDPIDFDRFWDDLALIERAACSGGGICLDPAFDSRIPGSVKAYLLETIGGGTRLRVSYATSTPSGTTCQSSEERWWLHSHQASWTFLDDFDLPPNGALWANQHVVLGRNEANPFVLNGALTVYAGDSSARRNIIFGSDVVYLDPNGATDVLGIIASDEVWTNPYAVGSDADLNLHGAFLNQNGNWRTAKACGSSGSSLTPESSILNTWGSNASLGTGNHSCCFEIRNYVFDPRLERLRPPFFPLLSDDWTYTNWREVPTPCWADSPSCP